MPFANESWTPHEGDYQIARLLLRSYLELKASEEGADDERMRALRSDAMELFPRAFWINLAKQVRIQGLSTEEELNACQAQRMSAEQDSAHPLSPIWRPASEAHFQAIVLRMKEGLPWADVPVLEEALVTACGFIDKRGLEQSYRPPAHRAHRDSRRDTERRCAAWRYFLNLTPTRAQHFDDWLDCKHIGEDYRVGTKPKGMEMGPQPPQFYLSLSLRYPDGQIPKEDRRYGPAAFTEDIPASVEDCHRLLHLDTPSLLCLKAVPWPAWNARMDALVAELADTCGCDSDETWTALDRVIGDYPKGYELMSEMLEEIDVWRTLTGTPMHEMVLEEEERCSIMVETLHLRKPRDDESGLFQSGTALVELERVRLLRHGITHPSASLLGPVDTCWMHSSARALAGLLGERAAAVYLQKRCAAPLAETLRRIEAMRPYWSEAVTVPGESDEHQDWATALQNLPTELRTLLTGDPKKTSTNEFITATRKEWVECFRQLPPSWLDCGEGFGPPAGQLLAALPDEALLEANVDGFSGFQEFSSIKFPLAALSAVVACSSTGRPNLQKLRAAKKASPPIGSGWVEAHWM